MTVEKSDPKLKTKLKPMTKAQLDKKYVWGVDDIDIVPTPKPKASK